jgi:hypothetical protein
MTIRGKKAEYGFREYRKPDRHAHAEKPQAVPVPPKNIHGAGGEKEQHHQVIPVRFPRKPIEKIVCEQHQRREQAEERRIENPLSKQVREEQHKLKPRGREQLHERIPSARGLTRQVKKGVFHAGSRTIPRLENVAIAGRGAYAAGSFFMPNL